MSSSSPQAKRFVTNETMDIDPNEYDNTDNDRPNGIRHSRDQEPFYLMHEHRFRDLLVRAHAGESPDSLLMENWVDTQQVDGDSEEEMEVAMGKDGCIVIMANLDEDEEVDDVEDC